MDEHEHSPDDWARLAREVRRRRVDLEMTQPQLTAAGGPSLSIVSKIEGAKQGSYGDRSLARLEKALQWTPGSIVAILRGAPPTPLGQQPPGTTTPTELPPAPASEGEAAGIAAHDNLFAALLEELSEVNRKLDKLSERLDRETDDPAQSRQTGA